MTVVVIDTNVWISAFLNPKGFPARLIQSGKTGSFLIISSLPLLDELQEVLLRPRIMKIRGTTEIDVEFFMAGVAGCGLNSKGMPSRNGHGSSADIHSFGENTRQFLWHKHMAFIAAHRLFSVEMLRMCENVRNFLVTIDAQFIDGQATAHLLGMRRMAGRAIQWANIDVLT